MTERPGELRQQSDAVLTFRMRVGCLLRKRARATIEGQAMLAGLDVQCHEARGWLDSTFYFRVSGPSDDVVRFSGWLDGWSRALKA